MQSRDHILNTYSEKISQYAEKRFARNDVNIIVNARWVYVIQKPDHWLIRNRVSEVTPEKVILTIKDSKDKSAKAKTVEIPSGFVLWSTGIGEYSLSLDDRAGRLSLLAAMQPFTKRLVELLPNQYHNKAVQVDGYLRVTGAPTGTVYAIGDASTVSFVSLHQCM